MALDVEKYRGQLLEEQARLNAELNINRVAEDTYAGINDEIRDEADAALMGETADISAELVELKSKRVEQVDSALQRIDDGTYGVCENCGKKIAIKRLDADPAALYCIDCATLLEGDTRMPTL
ncbi:MAG TPA: TraR/DksA C4-type zinc finger protein [Blastocatellia bacterium]|nr:TraR/DksA C4-type zinc finger protein [Blastocatellia bacterium]